VQRRSPVTKPAEEAEDEKRQTPRLPIDRTVRIALGDGTQIACAMSDVSKSGARLGLEDASKLPDEFELMLRDDLRKWCRVMRRSETSVGIKFIATPNKSAGD
jgi:hypothetical protein